jgi:hypothetical protein
MMIAAMAAAVSTISALRLVSEGAGFSGAGAAATRSGWVLIACAGLLAALEITAVAVGGDMGAAKATGLAVGRGCAIVAVGGSVAGPLLLRPTV